MRQLVDRREIAAELPSFDGVADGPGQQSLSDRAVDEVILCPGVKGHGAVGFPIRGREDQDGGGGDLEPERLERLQRARVVERHDHRVLVRSRAERREVRDPRDLETLALQFGPEVISGAHQQHADLVASHVVSSRAGSSYPGAPRRHEPPDARSSLANAAPDSIPASMAPERFSVLLPVYAGDAPGSLERAFESVTADQERPPAEAVIVRDGPVAVSLAASLDRLVGESPVPVTVVELPENRGLARALEAGLAACRYDIVGRMDADDISLPERFAMQVPLVEDGLDVVGSSLVEMGRDERDLRGIRRPPLTHEAIVRYARFHSPFNHPTVVLRRSVVARVGGYEQLTFFEDYWLWVASARGWCPSRERGSAAPPVSGGVRSVRAARGTEARRPRDRAAAEDATDRVHVARAVHPERPRPRTLAARPRPPPPSLVRPGLQARRIGETRCRGPSDAGRAHRRAVVGIRPGRDRGRDDRARRERSPGGGTSTSSASPLVTPARPRARGTSRYPFGTSGSPRDHCSRRGTQLRWPAVERATGPVDVVHGTIIAVPPSAAPLVLTIHDLAFLSHPEHFSRSGSSLLPAGTRARAPRRADGHLPVGGDDPRLRRRRVRGRPAPARAVGYSSGDAERRPEGTRALAVRARATVHPVLRHRRAPQEPPPSSRGVPVPRRPRPGPRHRRTEGVAGRHRGTAEGSRGTRDMARVRSVGRPQRSLRGCHGGRVSEPRGGIRLPRARGDGPGRAGGHVGGDRDRGSGG